MNLRNKESSANPGTYMTELSDEIVRFHKDDKGTIFKNLPWHLQEKIKARLNELENVDKEYKNV